MARNDDSQRDKSKPSRVYKSSDVHKRRVDRKGRSKDAKGDGQAARPASPGEADAQGAGMPEGAGFAREAGQTGQQAVVITPEFGRRSAAQREADDRWFAAMREADAMPEADATLEKGAARETGAMGERVETALQEKAPAASDASDAKPDAESAPAKDAPGPSASGGGGQSADAARRAKGPSTGESPAVSDDAQPAEPPSSGPKPRKLRLPALPKRARIAIIVVAAILVAAIVAAGLFAWNRWHRFDDHADMQGTWYVVGTTVPVAIDDSSIHLTGDVSYQYEIDAHDKTIRYAFGPMEGQGRYWFSDDRQYLVITDGDEFTGTSTAIDDLLHAFADTADNVAGDGAKLPEGEGVVAFCREPDSGALAKQQAEAAAKAAADEAERKAAEEEAARIAAEEAAEAAAWDGYYAEEPSGEEPPAEETPGEEAPEGEPTDDEPVAGEPSTEEPAEEPVGEEALPEDASFEGE